MANYRVTLKTSAYRVVTVEALNAEEARDGAIDEYGYDELMTLDHEYPDLDAWEVDSVEEAQ